MNKLRLIFSFAFVVSNVFCFGQLHKDWATYYGRWNLGSGFGTTVSSSVYDPVNHCIYIAGETSDTVGIATQGSFKSSMETFNLFNSDVFLAKFDTLGNRIWATYYGGTGRDGAANIAVDGLGNVYLAGKTGSATGIATPGSYKPTLLTQDSQNGWDFPFLVKFNSNGQRIWGTYYDTLAPNGNGYGVIGNLPGIVIDKGNNVYMSGSTGNLYGHGTPGTFQPSRAPASFPFSNIDGFIVKFNSNGARVWGTYYGGDGNDGITSLYIDEENFLYALGVTSSTDVIASGTSSQTQFSGGNRDAFIAKFTLNGQRVWGAYIGGSGNEDPLTITGSAEIPDAVFVAGVTTSTNGIATTGAHQPIFGGGDNDEFLMRYNADGTKEWGTYFGGEHEESIEFSHTTPVNSLLVDKNKNITMVGATNSVSNIKDGCAYQNELDKSGFIARFNQDGTLDMGSYYDAMLASIVGVPQNPDAIYVSGRATKDGITTPGALQSSKIANQASGFFSKIIKQCPLISFPVHQAGNVLSVDSGHISYQWYYNGILVSGATHPNLTTSADSGTYYVLINDDCGCQYTSDTLDLYQQTSIHETQNDITINLFPNPSDGKLTINGSITATNAIMYYEVADIMGRRLIEGNFKSSNRNFGQSFDFSFLKNGVYTLKLWCNEKNAVFKWVKNH